MKKCISWHLMINMKKILTLFFIFLFLLSGYTIAKLTRYKIPTGFLKDNCGTSFYYDDNNYYNDGWHLIDDNGDCIYEYYYFSLSGHMIRDAIAPNGYQLNQDGKLI